ncbi:MAG: DNA translocase FtsK 4TM domain-containing protein [Flavobacteriales bacterium]
MAKKSNTSKANSFKEEKAEAPKKERKPRISLAERITFLRNDRFKKSFGLTCVLFSLFLFIAFTSYLIFWKTDQDKVDGQAFFSFLFSEEVEVKNWLGKLGAFISHRFLHNGMGLVSYVFSVLLFVIGVRVLFDVKLLSIKKILRFTLVVGVWVSVFLGAVFNSPHDFMGGAFGFVISNWLFAALGKAGTVLTLVFAGIIGFVVMFNPDFKSMLSWLDNTEEDELEDESLQGINVINTIREDDIIKETAPVEVNLSEDDKEIELGNDAFGKVEPEIDEIIEESLIESIAMKSDDFSVEVPEQDEVLSSDEINDKLKEFGEYDPKLDLSTYQIPPLELLKEYGSNNISVNKEELEENKNKIVATLANYNIEIAKIKATIGPTVTLYEIIPAPGVRISKIKNLEDDIALSLAALGIRIIAPIPGKGTIGIEVPNSKPEVVSMRTLIASEKFQNADMELPVALGKTITNETFVTDLAKMPHLLMAGATGQGKSVGLNAILVSILYKKHPAQVKFVLVDPKKVELTLFNKIERHFLAKLPGEAEAIITDNSKVVTTLNSLCVEMDNRYELLKEAGVRNIKEYNAKFIARKLNPEKGHLYLPYIVLVVDEFADLIMTAGKEVETPIARLAQLARAIGIHLIIATQRPSVNIITGIIKANFPARIAFRVTSKIDSRTILDAGGADQLIGRGDMLFSTGNDLIRIQCGFVDTPEVDDITDFIGTQRGYPDAFLLPEYVGEASEAVGDFDDGDLDPLFDDAAMIVVNSQQGSASLLQRKLKLGYNRAGRLIDQLEAVGILGPHQGSKARDVLFPDTVSLEQFLKNRKGDTTNTDF